MSRNSLRLFMLTDFRRGVRFVHGIFANVLEPGSYRINTTKELVSIVDMRPQPLLFERCRYRDALNRPSIASIRVDLAVYDPHLAVTKLKDHMKDAVPLVNDAFRATVPLLVVDTSAEGRGKIAKAIAKAVNTQLAQFGLRVAPVEIIELYSQELAEIPGTGLDVTQ